MFFLSRARTEDVGTKGFCAPEVLAERYTERCDVYSAGVLFVSTATGLMYDPEAPEAQQIFAEPLGRFFNEKRSTYKTLEIRKPKA